MSSRLYFQISVLATATLLSVGCARTPAKLVRDHSALGGSFNWEREGLHALLEKALENPNRGESAVALGKFVSEWNRERRDDSGGEVSPAESAEGRYRVDFIEKESARYLPSYFDEIRPSELYRVKRIESHKRDGIGATLIAVRENSGLEKIERFYPPEAISREVTAVVHPGALRGNTRTVKIELIDSLTIETVEFDGRREPLAADFSAAYAALLERCRELSRSEIGDILSATPKRDPQLYLMEPYNPRKEPLLMIHGFLDSPLTWAEMTNDLRSKPEFRRRFQVWHYFYNTSAPALYSGRILRTQLKELRDLVDPNRNDPATRRVTLVSHSMGGIVSRSLISSPGDAFWEAAFTRPLSSLVLSEADRRDLQEAFFWQAEPSVRRVIFICTPHRGTKAADNPIGRLARGIVKPPSKFREFYERISEANPGAFTPAYQDLGSGKLNSVGSLSPKQPTLQILADLPLGYPVELHTIVGDRGRPGELENSSDGVVPYESSHIGGAVSETVLPYRHSCLDKPKTIGEVRKILEID